MKSENCHSPHPHMGRPTGSQIKENMLVVWDNNVPQNFEDVILFEDKLSIVDLC